MTWYIYPPMVALDQNGQPVASTSGQIYADTDDAGVTPLAIRDLNGNTVSSVEVNSFYLTQGFQIEDMPEANWRSGDIVVALNSPKGMRIAAEAAQAAASQALSDIQDFLSSTPTELPSGKFPGAGLFVASDGSLVWLVPPSGGGGSGITSYTQIVSLPGYPAGGFAGASHLHQVSDLRNTSNTALQTMILNLLQATTPQGARAAIGAGIGNGTSDVTVNGVSTGAAMPASKSFKSDEIGLIASIVGLPATTVHEALVALAARGSGGGSVPDGINVTRAFASGAYPPRGSTLAAPPSVIVIWRGPVWPPQGGLYMQSGDEYKATAS